MLLHIAFASKNLSSAEWQYINIYREALGILHELEKFTTTVLHMEYMSSQTVNH